MPNAEHELDRLYELDVDSAATIDVLLDELSSGSSAFDVLYRPAHHFLHRPPFEVKRFAAMQRRGYNVYTLRVHAEDGELLRWRVLMAHHAQIDTWFVLAVAPRKDAYEVGNPGFAAIIERYEQAGIPRYRG